MTTMPVPVPMRVQLRAFAASGLSRLRHPRELGWQALLVTGWLLAVIGDVVSTWVGLGTGAATESDPAAAAAMQALTPHGYLLATAAAGLCATVLVAGRARTWWHRALLCSFTALTTVKTIAIVSNLHGLAHL